MANLCCQVYDWDENGRNKYVVVFSRYKGKLLFSRHQERDTWETQGGHIEPGESAEAAARRELWEESGAEKFAIEPVCRYYAWEAGDKEGGSWGAVFFADIQKLGALPESEMAQVQEFDSLPEGITYPGITPFIFERVRERYGQKS